MAPRQAPCRPCGAIASLQRPLRNAAGCDGDGGDGDAEVPARDLVCHGYVGQGARPAAQYHERDFDWDEHARAVRHIVEAQQAQGLAIRSEQLSRHPDGQQQQQQQQEQRVHGSGMEARGLAERGLPPPAASGGIGTGSGTSTGISTKTSSDPSCIAANAAASPPGAAVLSAHRASRLSQPATDLATPPPSITKLPAAAGGAAAPVATAPATAPNRAAADVRSQSHTADVAGATAATAATASPSSSSPSSTAVAAAAAAEVAAYEGSKWEDFYRAHPSARFFKERRYLLLEFPDLLRSEHVAEIGCGCGSSILPVLKANPASRTTCTDISTTCLDQLVAAAAAEGVSPERLAVFPADATDPAAAPSFEGVDADALLIMFTLSAVTPEQQHAMLRHAWRALRPGGRFMIRDHGLYDMVQLRISPDQWVGPNLYKRGDGTIAYFFSTEELARRASGAGFDIAECKYVTVVNRNRKTGVELRRVFVHGVFVKPMVADEVTNGAA